MNWRELLAEGSGVGEILEREYRRGAVLEEFTPFPWHLEWKLGQAWWQQQGVKPFLNRQVPFLVNCSGRASSDAAAVLFANCEEHVAAEEPIEILELGAGTGLFSLLLLDEFQILCEQAGRDYYRRLRCWVTDGSAETVQFWQRESVFDRHGERVVLQQAAARDAIALGRGKWQAVFANYLLDSLPAAKLRRSENGWEMAELRTLLPDDVEIRAYLAADREEALQWAGKEPLRLLPLMPVLTHQARYVPLTGEMLQCVQPYLDWMPDWPDLMSLNYESLALLEGVEARLGRGGYVAVRDYGQSGADSDRPAPGADRFGGTTATGLNFGLLENWAAGRGWRVIAPEQEWITRWRLLGSPGARTEAEFRQRAALHRGEYGWAVETARQLFLGERYDDGLAVLREEIKENPRDWNVLGEGARHLLYAYDAAAEALELAKEALRICPWYAVEYWQLAGRCLARLGRAEEAHRYFERAWQLSPDHAETCLELGESWLGLHQAEEALRMSVAARIADQHSMQTHKVEELYLRAAAQLSQKRIGEQDCARRRWES